MLHINLNKLLPLLLLTLLLIGFPQGARAEIAETFDMKSLSDAYALSCHAQGVLRHTNILPPHFPGRPKEFHNEDESLAIYSPHLTKKERALARRVFASVPDYALPIAWRGGAVYVFVRRSLVEAVPALAVEPGWYADFGLYMAVERRLYLPFEKGEGVYRKPDGTYGAGRFVPSQREPFRIVNHETGHMIDSMLGAYSLDSMGEDGELRLSNRPDYLESLHEDLHLLASPDRPISIDRIHKLGYYMPYEFEGVVLGGVQPSDQRAFREIFAELWAEAHGHAKNKLSEAYPDTFRLVKSIAAFLKAQYRAAPTKCWVR